MAVSTPSVPGSTVAVVNNSGQAVVVTITGGTMTNVSVNSTTVGAGAGTYGLPSGGSIQMTYTVAPTWAWAAAAPAIGYTPGYAVENTAAYNPYSGMEYAAHPTGGFTGFAVGVSN